MPKLRFLAAIVALVVLISIVLFISQSKDSRPVLRVLSYDSFIKSWGPGPQLKAQFEVLCNCQVEFLLPAETTHMLDQKNILKQRVDIVIGFDQYEILKNKGKMRWHPLQNNFEFVNELKNYQEPEVLPFDYGPLAFVKHKDDKTNVTKFDDLLNPHWLGGISLIDARTSNTGLQFLMWLLQVKGEDGALTFLRKLDKNIHALPSSWSAAYGLFTRGRAKAVFSYLTSPLYLQIYEKKDLFEALIFTEGHPIQVEYLGIPESCAQCEIATDFAKYLLTAPAQNLIMYKNMMLPAIKGIKEGTEFAQLPDVKILPPISMELFNRRVNLIQMWSAIRRED